MTFCAKCKLACGLELKRQSATGGCCPYSKKQCQDSIDELGDRATKQAFHRLRKGRGVDWFRDIPVESGVQSLFPVPAHGVGRDCEHGQSCELRILANFLDHAKSI